MSRHFRAKGKQAAPRWLVVVALLGIFIIFYELWDVIVPFQAQNPLWNEVTVGEKVIDGWQYGGEDEEGYLKFFNPKTGFTHVLPPDSHLISLDGQFVIIEDYSPGTLTYALPMEAISLPWLIGGTIVIVGGVYLLQRRLRSARRPLHRTGSSGKFRAKRISVIAIPRQTRAKRFRTTRFRANRSGKSRFHL